MNKNKVFLSLSSFSMVYSCILANFMCQLIRMFISHSTYWAIGEFIHRYIHEMFYQQEKNFIVRFYNFTSHFGVEWKSDLNDMRYSFFHWINKENSVFFNSLLKIYLKWNEKEKNKKYLSCAWWFLRMKHFKNVILFTVRKIHFWFQQKKKNMRIY